MTTVDAHHHFWDPSRAEYPWMTEELASIRRAFGPRDLLPLLDTNGIDSTVLVQTRSSVEETAEFLATAAAHPFVAGVVGWIDLASESAADEIARVRALTGGDRLVSIRHQVHDETDPRWLTRPAVRRGLRAVESAGLAYDLLVRTRELPAAIEVVDALPQMRFVLDHIAKPPVASGEIESWASAIRTLARRQNVVCKLSGIVTEADWSSWTPESIQPYVDVVLDAFGSARLMFGSDWPVCLLAASYAEVVGLARELTANVSQTERDRIFGGTAVEVYGLPAA